jgi:hypothetical protein
MNTYKPVFHKRKKSDVSILQNTSLENKTALYASRIYFTSKLFSLILVQLLQLYSFPNNVRAKDFCVLYARLELEGVQRINNKYILIFSVNQLIYFEDFNFVRIITARTHKMPKCSWEFHCV